MNALCRKVLVSRHNPVLDHADFESPLTVGNGSLAFTADITGLQTLAPLYEAQGFPLCTMSDWGWHSHPGKPGPGDLRPTLYATRRGTVTYAVKKFPGNEAVYDWLRENPHRLNLASIALTMNGKAIAPDMLTAARQELHLYEGRLESSFTLSGYSFRIETLCSPESPTLSFLITARSPNGFERLPEGLSVSVRFPYGSSGISGSDWKSVSAHTTVVRKSASESSCRIERYLDGDAYSIALSAPLSSISCFEDEHRVDISPKAEQSALSVSLCFQSGTLPSEPPDFHAVRERSAEWWKGFWETGGAIDLSRETDSRAAELERRIILSRYLLAVNSAGSMPPAETGLTCNSWYGKFHLEMHPLHALWMPLWGHGDLLERSLGWYRSILGKAKENARKNGYLGARWPKMVGPEGVDSPSPIATLLVWQQPHIISLLEALRKTGKDEAFLLEWRDCVYETAVFMADFAEYDHETKKWNLEGPLIPVQEEFDPETVKNPVFENAYWSWGLRTAARWLELLGERPPVQWQTIADNMAKGELPPDIFTAYNRDHPSFLMPYGYLDGNDADANETRELLHRVLREWDFTSLWGWDFAVMAMTAHELEEYPLMLDLLLADSPKNHYSASGNNFQKTRTDLPLYLPGNGSLLLAIAACLPGIGRVWNVQHEGIQSLHGDTDDN